MESIRCFLLKVKDNMRHDVMLPSRPLFTTRESGDLSAAQLNRFNFFNSSFPPSLLPLDDRTCVQCRP